jgi:hypothetical protein
MTTARKGLAMSNLSRRSLVASAAALPALAVPTVATPQCYPVEPDAELIKLAETYERIFRIRAPLVADYNERWTRGIELAGERADHGPPKTYEVELERAWFETGSDKANEKLKPVDDQLSDLASKIMDTPAHTAAGLRARVALVADAYSDLWDEPFDDLDWEKKVLRRLIEAICSLGGFALPTETMGLAVQS